MKRSYVKQGFSLLELLLSLGIIALIILMATRYFTTARNAQLTTSAVQQIQGIRSATSNMLAQGLTLTSSGAANTGNISLQAICTAGLLPSTYCDPKNALITPWTTAGDNTVNYVATPTSTTTDLFKLVYQFPNYQACMAVKNSFTSDLDSANSSCCGGTPATPCAGTFNFLQ